MLGSAISLVALAGCGPFTDGKLVGEEVFRPGGGNWEIFDYSISPDGSWILVGETWFPDQGFRLSRVQLSNHEVQEIPLDEKAQAQARSEGEPVLQAAEWDLARGEVWFPSFSIAKGGYDVSPTQSGQLNEIAPVIPRSSSWFEVLDFGGSSPAVTLRDGANDLRRLSHVSPRVDPRIRFHEPSRSGFDVLDHEHGDRVITHFSSGWMSIDPLDAAVSPDAQWIALRIGRENFGNKGHRGVLIRRGDGKSYFLENWVRSLLQFHPTRPEVYGVACADLSKRWALYRWSYAGELAR